MIELIIASLFAGALTVLAPCVASVIPILLARSGSTDRPRSAFFVIGGLSLSIILFTVLLKASTLFIGIPSSVWTYVSGGIILLFGVFTIFPNVWDEIVLRTRFVFAAQKNLSKATTHQGYWADTLLGASLGPVFSACSPTYALIVAVILPASPLLGLLYLLAFVVGLATMLSLIAIFGNKLIRKLGWGLNPNGLFRKILGVVLIILGSLIITGVDKIALGALVQNGWYDFQINLENGLVQ